MSLVLLVHCASSVELHRPGWAVPHIGLDLWRLCSSFACAMGCQCASIKCVLVYTDGCNPAICIFSLCASMSACRGVSLRCRLALHICLCAWLTAAAPSMLQPHPSPQVYFIYLLVTYSKEHWPLYSRFELGSPGW